MIRWSWAVALMISEMCSDAVQQLNLSVKYRWGVSRIRLWSAELCSCACVLSNVRSAGGDAGGERVPGSFHSRPGREELPAVCGLQHGSSSGPVLLDKTEGGWSSGDAVLWWWRAAGAQRGRTHRRHHGGRPARFLQIQLQLPRQAWGRRSGGPGRARWRRFGDCGELHVSVSLFQSVDFQFESRTYWFHILWSFRSKPCTCTQTASACALTEARTRISASALLLTGSRSPHEAAEGLRTWTWLNQPPVR